MTARDIVKLLRVKHSEDVFVDECKDGPTLSSTHCRLDGWAMQKSWTNPTTFGYEVKITRNDFQRDDKWQSYLGLCSDFYFVCPYGLIQPDEVGSPAGLLWVAQTGTKLWMKKKAVRRPDVQIPETMWRYLLMRLDPKHWRTDAEFWQDWLADKNRTLDVGHRISKVLREMISSKIHEVECESKRLKSENEALAHVKKLCEALGVSPHSYRVEEILKSKIDRMNQALPEDFVFQLQNLQRSIERVLKEVGDKKPAPESAG